MDLAGCLNPAATSASVTRREWLGLAVIALPCLVNSMDLTVLNLALPRIAADLKPSSAELLWIVDIYGFFVAGLLVPMGNVGDRIGRLLIGAAAFCVAAAALRARPVRRRARRLQSTSGNFREGSASHHRMHGDPRTATRAWSGFVLRAAASRRSLSGVPGLRLLLVVLTAAAGCGGSGATAPPGVDAEIDRPAVDAGTDPPLDAAVAVDAVGFDVRTEDAAAETANADSGQTGDVGDAANTDTGQAGDAPDAGDADAQQSPDAGSPADAGRPGIMVVATYLGGIHGFTIDASGAPKPAGMPLDTGAQFYALTAHPTGSFIYAADFRGRVYGYRVNRDDGTLAAVPDSPRIIGGQAVTAAIDPQGRVLYVGNSGDDFLYVFAIDGTTGALTSVDGSPFALGAAPAGIAFHPTAALAFISSSAASAAGGGGIHVFHVDAVGRPTGETAGSPFFPTLFGGALVMHPSGKFLYDSAFGVHAYGIAPSGSLTELPESPHPGAASDNSAIDIAVDPSGEHLYASSNSSGTVTAYGVDATTGAFTRIEGSPFDGGQMPYSLAVDRTGRFLYVGNDDADQVSVLPLDLATGELRLPITGSPFVVHGLQPEIVLIGP